MASSIFAHIVNLLSDLLLFFSSVPAFSGDPWCKNPPFGGGGKTIEGRLGWLSTPHARLSIEGKFLIVEGGIVTSTGVDSSVY